MNFIITALLVTFFNNLQVQEIIESQYDIEDANLIVDAEEIDSSYLYNARRTELGHIMMGVATSSWSIDRRYAEAWADELEELGIRAIVSFHPPHPLIVEVMRERDFILFHEEYESMHDDHWNFHWWLGYDNNWSEELVDFYQRFEPEEIAIHCAYGVDRTGNATAFILSVLYNVPIEDAWYAVVNNDYTNISGLSRVLNEFIDHETRGVDDSGVSEYTYNGQGMKAHSDGFRDYIRHTIQDALDLGAQF